MIEMFENLKIYSQTNTLNSELGGLGGQLSTNCVSGHLPEPGYR